jgi:hypothetical protein
VLKKTCFCISRRLITLNEEEEGVNKAGPKPVRFLGPSTSTQIKVKNSASVRVTPANTVQTSSQVTAKLSQSSCFGKAAQYSVSPVGMGTSGYSSVSRGTQNAENGAAHPPPAKVLLSEKKSTSHRVIKLKRTPLCAAVPSFHTLTEGRQGSSSELAPPEASSTLGMQTENDKDQADG